jgi:ribosomal protein L33
MLRSRAGDMRSYVVSKNKQRAKQSLDSSGRNPISAIKHKKYCDWLYCNGECSFNLENVGAL